MSKEITLISLSGEGAVKVVLNDKIRELLRKHSKEVGTPYSADVPHDEATSVLEEMFANSTDVKIGEITEGDFAFVNFSW